MTNTVYWRQWHCSRMISRHLAENTFNQFWTNYNRLTITIIFNFYFFLSFIFLLFLFFLSCLLYSFDGLTLEELCSYLDDPWWKLLRRGIFISFWIVFVAIFASACIISIVEYEQQCTINSMKSALYHVVSGGGDDDGAIVRNNTLSTSSTASNTTALQWQNAITNLNFFSFSIIILLHLRSWRIRSSLVSWILSRHQMLPCARDVSYEIELNSWLFVSDSNNSILNITSSAPTCIIIVIIVIVVVVVIIIALSNAYLYETLFRILF